MPIKSYDPRVTRLGIEYDAQDFNHPGKMDQFETYEVFTQTREGKSFDHVGIMHGADETLAFLEAKEQYGRRGKCFGVWIVKTGNVHVSPYAPLDENVFDLFRETPPAENKGEVKKYHIFLQKKRGKQHGYIGEVEASLENVLPEAARRFGTDHNGCNVWFCESEHVLKSNEEDKAMWVTVPEKHFREALIYKVKDRIEAYKKRIAQS